MNNKQSYFKVFMNFGIGSKIKNNNNEDITE